MTETLRSILALTCTVPAIAGIIRFGIIERAYRVLVFIFLAALLVEVTGILQSKGYLNEDITWHVDIFTIANTLMHVYFFRKMNVLVSKKVIAAVIISLGLIYAVSIIYYGSFTPMCTIIAAIFSNIIILCLCIEGVIQYTFSNKTKWFTETISVYCLINILYTAHFIFIFSLRLTSLNTNQALMNSVENIHSYLNAACNLLFTWPILCIPRRKKYMK